MFIAFQTERIIARLLYKCYFCRDLLDGIMTIDDIKALIASDESRTLEVKKTTGELKDGMHAACAFLNTEGGWLIFGVAPKSLKIVGQEVTDDTQREIAQAIAGLQPALDMRPDYIDVPDRPGFKVIAMHFDGWVWGERPHTFHGCPYYKVESTTKVMPQDMYDERIRAFEPKTYSWELRQAEGVTIDDLNEKHIRGCIRMGVEGGRIPVSALSEPISDTLSKWKLLKNGIPTNGAAMLFSDKVDEYDNFKIKMARFLGTDKNEFIDEMRVEGNFFDLLDAGLAFCFKHLNLSGKITNHSLQREERLEIPYKALREAIINSLCHRQWERYNLLNSIAIYDDRVEIGNPGIFPSQITPESIKEPHDSYPYNVKMAEVLYRSMWLENWGSGAKRIIEACQEQGVEEPTWRWDGAFVYVTFKRPTKVASDTPKDNLGGNDTLSTPQAPPKHPLSTPQVKLLTEKMGDSYMTMKEIAELCGIKDLKYFRESYIIPALEAGVLERLYPNQPKHPKQKYKLHI